MTAEFGWIATVAVLLPALVGALLLALPRVDRAAPVLGIAASLGSLGLFVQLLATGARGVAIAWEWAPSLFITVAWRIDVATLGLGVLVAGVGALVLQFAGAYFGPKPKGRRAIALLCIFEATMLGLVFADSLLLLFTFWELTGLCSFFLILTDSDKRDDTFAAAQQALVVTVGGALPMLIGFLYLIQATGTGSLSELVGFDLPVRTQTIALALILPGVLTKSAQAPCHFWLPGAMAAPTPISAYLHSATMVKAGLIALLYLYPICGASPLWSGVLIPLGVLTCFWGAWQALRRNDVKQLMAWSTVSQLGLMAVTAGLGNPLAIRAATLYLLAHAVFKAGLFLGIGAIDHAAGTRKLSELGGLRHRAPFLCAVVALLAGSMAGLPPFAGFLSKELVLKKLLLGDTALHDLAVLGILIGSIGTAAYTARFFFGVFFGAPRSPGARDAQPAGVAFLLAPATLAVLSLAGGLGARYVDRWLLEPMTTALLGVQLDVPELRLWHGVNVPLILSGVILTLGWTLHRVAGHRHLPSLPVLFDGTHGFEVFLTRAQRLGGVCNRLLAGASPNVYVALLLAFALWGAWPLAGGLAGWLTSDWYVGGVPLLVGLAVGLALIVRLESKVGRILSLTAVGFAVALLYGALDAPDLVLTQLLVEVLTTIFFLLAARFIGHREPARQALVATRALRLAFASTLGLAAAAIVFALHATPARTRVADYYFEAGPAIAKGRNLVNLVLSDFRALDTLIETLVVLVVGLGVIGLLRGEELSPRREEAKR